MKKKLISQPKFQFWISLGIAFALFSYFVFPSHSKQLPQFQVGEIWNKDPLVATENLPILKSNIQIQFESDEIQATTLPVFIRKSRNLISPIFRSDVSLNCQNQVDSVLSVFLNTSSISAKPIQYEVVIIKEAGTLTKVSARSIIQSQDDINRFFQSRLDANCFSKCTDVLPRFLEAINIEFDSLETLALLAKRMQLITKTEGVIPQGTSIINKGELITEAKSQEIKSYYQFENQDNSSFFGISSKLGYALFSIILFWVLALYIYQFLPKVFVNRQQATFLVLMMVLLCLLTKFSLSIELSAPIVIPFTIIPLVIRQFFDERPAIFFHLITLLYCSMITNSPFDVLCIHLLAGMGLILVNLRINIWSQFFNSILVVFVIYFTSFVAIRLIYGGLTLEILGVNLARIVLNVFITLAAYPLVPAFEKIFGLVSELTLIELSNVDKPLLNKLRGKAPGTFQHSLQVASLAEAATQKIGGNALLAKVGALYHDIGKIEDPHFFIENQHGINPHEQITYTESAAKIRKHVQSGIELAEKYKLPNDVKRFIPTHHGTTLVEYFYLKAKEEADRNSETINIADFQYDGERPQTKEEAIVMLADTVEAASKSLQNPTSNDLIRLIDTLVQKKIDENQLEKVPLTFQDIYYIKYEFYRVLKSVYHFRIAYPTSSEPS